MLLVGIIYLKTDTIGGNSMENNLNTKTICRNNTYHNLKIDIISWNNVYDDLKVHTISGNNRTGMMIYNNPYFSCRCIRRINKHSPEPSRRCFFCIMQKVNLQ